MFEMRQLEVLPERIRGSVGGGAGLYLDCLGSSSRRRGMEILIWIVKIVYRSEMLQMSAFP